MGTIIAFFQFLWKVFKAILNFVVSLPGLIVSAIFGVVGFVSALASNVYNVCSHLVIILDDAQSYVNQFTEFLSQQPLWGMFYRFVALDVFGTCFTYFVGLLCTLIVLMVFEFFFQGVVVAVPFMIYKSVGKLLQAVSAGFTKPA